MVVNEQCTPEIRDSSIVSKQHGPIGFLDLPLETRRQIYANLFNENIPPSFYVMSAETVPHYRNGIDTRILRTSRQIHEEARKVLLENSSLVAVSSKDPRLGPRLTENYCACLAVKYGGHASQHFPISESSSIFRLDILPSP